MILSSFLCMAQDRYTEKGRILISPSTSLSLSGVNIEDVDDQLFTASIELSGGYFFVDNLVGGLVTGYDYSKFGDLDDWSYNVGVFSRYYTKPYVYFGVGYLLTQSKDNDLVGTIPIELGYAYFINKHFALEPALLFGIGAQNNDTFIYALSIGFGIYLN